MTDAPKTPTEHPRLWVLTGMASFALLAMWASSQLFSDDPISFWWLAASILLGVPAFVMPRRESRAFMEYSRRMNRGKMDQPGWTKKPWQHDEGSNKR